MTCPVDAGRLLTSHQAGDVPPDIARPLLGVCSSNPSITHIALDLSASSAQLLLWELQETKATATGRQERALADGVTLVFGLSWEEIRQDAALNEAMMAE